MNNQIQNRLYLYQITVIFSVLFSLAGFSYNVWRMEASEQNNNIRTASFEVLLELAKLEQLVYAAHYDKNIIEGSPRKGWVKVGLINDLSMLTSKAVENKSSELRAIWSANWSTMSQNQDAANEIVKAIDAVKAEIKSGLASLK